MYLFMYGFVSIHVFDFVYKKVKLRLSIGHALYVPIHVWIWVHTCMEHVYKKVNLRLSKGHALYVPIHVWICVGMPIFVCIYLCV